MVDVTKFQTEGYEIEVMGRNVQVTEGMKQHAYDKLAKIERFADRILQIHCTMDIHKLEHRVDLVLWLDNTKIKVSASSHDMYASIDKAAQRLERKVRRYHARIRAHHAKGMQPAKMEVEVVRSPDLSFLEDLNDEIEEENLREIEEALKPHEIVARETMPLKTLNYQEAVMKMDLSGDAFMLFINESDRKLKAIYRRDDGNYGIIEPAL
ncbi:MAG: ribosome-associated translation inhibitor RaiA [Parachlamydiales bacterium]